jgi:hypothetical protein
VPDSVSDPACRSTPPAESWRPVVGWEALYEVSDFGNVRSLPRWRDLPQCGGPRLFPGRQLKPAVVDGYRVVSLADSSTRKLRKVHRLVLEAFVGPCPPEMEGCHGNGVRSDNRLENLRWGTKSDNNTDRVTHGTHHHTRKTHCPRGHELADPNLTTAGKRRGWRICRSCAKAAAHRSQARKHGRPVLGKQFLADRFYRALIGGAA